MQFDDILFAVCGVFFLFWVIASAWPVPEEKTENTFNIDQEIEKELQPYVKVEES